MSTVTTWRYRVQTPGWGWGAVVFIESSGLFVAHSDWGTYGHIWSAPGMAIREFVARLGERDDYDYLLSKLCAGRPQEFNGEATRRGIRMDIIEARRNGPWSRERARREWELTEGDFDNEVDFARWFDRTSMDDAWEYAQYEYPGQAKGFCERVMPELARMIRAELAAEQSEKGGGAP